MVFILSSLWWIRIRSLWKLPDGRDWLRGKLGLVLMGGVMLSKSLIQFSVDGHGCFPSLLFDLRPNCLLTKLFNYSVQFSPAVMSDSLRPHEPQHARPPCPSPSPGVHSDSRPSSPWCHPAISSWVVPFSSCPQSLPASESFPMSQLFKWGGQSTGASALASFLPKKSQGWFPCSPRDSEEYSPTPQFKSINSLALSFLYSPTLTSIHDYLKNHSFD